MPVFDMHAYFGDTPFYHGQSTGDAILQSMQRHGIDAMALISALARDCDFVRGNADLKTILSSENGLYGLVTLNSDYPEESMEQQRIHLSRKSFVGAVLFGHKGRPVTLESARSIVNAQRRYVKPLAIFTPDGESVRQAQRIAAEFPTIKFVLLCMGGDDWRDAVTAASQNLNLYLELSGSLDSDKIAQAAAAVTPRKLLYGSGTPNWSPEIAMAMIEDETTLTTLDVSRIYHYNAAGLFNLQGD